MKIDAEATSVVRTSLFQLSIPVGLLGLFETDFFICSDNAEGIPDAGGGHYGCRVLLFRLISGWEAPTILVRGLP